MLTKDWTWLYTPSILRIEWILLATILGISLVLPARSAALRAIKRASSSIATSQTRSVLLVMAVVLIGRVALIPKLGIPHPAIADEFGYLLTADTFAHGRLSNPTPPMWQHFESFHTIFRPTYQSQYPVGYPVVLAFAQVVLGNPWWGVLLTTAAMCGALVWMLQGWIPPFWSLVAGLLAAIRFGLFGYWVNSFWGGSLAALGGCLVFGSLPRLIPGLGRRSIYSRGPLVNAIAMGMGLAMLISTRPFEGGIICIPAAIVFFRWMAKLSRDALKKTVRDVFLPATAILLACCAFITYYQYKVTGRPLESPLGVALQQNHVVQPFIFQATRVEPHYPNPEFHYIYAIFERQEYDLMHEPYGFVQSLVIRFVYYWKFFVGPLLTLPAIALFFTTRLKKYRFIWFCLTLLVIALLLESWIQDHYLAPAFCLFILLLINGIRLLRTMRWGTFRLGTRVVRSLPVVCLVILAVRLAAYGRDCYENQTWPPDWAFSTMRMDQRDMVEDRLKATAGRHLVIVRYHYPFHNFHHDWIYNGADLTGTKILWARSMSEQQNCALAQAFADRKLWTVDEWGPSIQVLPATQKTVCDPKNVIYAPNLPPSYYLRGTEFDGSKQPRHG